MVGNWGSEGIARIGPATNEVSPKKLKTGACQQPGSLVDLTLRGRGVGGKSVESKNGEVLPSSQSSRASAAGLCERYEERIPACQNCAKLKCVRCPGCVIRLKTECGSVGDGAVR